MIASVYVNKVVFMWHFLRPGEQGLCNIMRLIGRQTVMAVAMQFIHIALFIHNCESQSMLSYKSMMTKRKQYIVKPLFLKHLCIIEITASAVLFYEW